MKLPWVSRAEYERDIAGVRATAQAMCDGYRRSEQAAFDRYGELLTKYMDERQLREAAERTVYSWEHRYPARTQTPEPRQ